MSQHLPPTGLRPLVVVADDLGLSRGVNRAIRRAHLHGVVGSTSLLAVGRHFDDAVTMLHATPTLGVGAHLALVGEDPPLLPTAQIDTLVDRRGRFPLGYRGFLARAAAGRVDRDQVRLELAAQLERITAAGLTPTHLDTHQHLHLWPLVGSVVVELARVNDIGHVRLPTTQQRTPVGVGVRLLSRRLAGSLARAGLPCVPYAGLDEAGRMDGAAIGRAVAVLARCGTGPAELNLHPGEDDPEHERFAWGYRWAHELAAAVDPGPPDRLRERGFAATSSADALGYRR